MADLYLLFADVLAQSIAGGRKTVTRRPMTSRNSTVDGRPWPRSGLAFASMQWDRAWIDPGFGDGFAYLHVPFKTEDDESVHRVRCTTEVGDTLIVREGFWQTIGPGHTDESGEYHRGPWTRTRVHYNAEGAPLDKYFGREQLIRRPSIHMPRWAARSVRKILSITPDLVGPESLLQEEAEREGFDSPEAFAEAWDRMYLAKHGPRVWTWRYEFEKSNAP